MVFLEGASYEQDGTTPYSSWSTSSDHYSPKKETPAKSRKFPEWAVSESGPIVPQILSETKEMGLQAWLKGPKSLPAFLPST